MHHDNNKSLKEQLSLLIILIFGLLSVPLIAMQFSAEVNWNVFDFLIMAILIFITGAFIILFNRLFPAKRTLIIVCFSLLFLWLWAELAVGIFTQWGQ